MAQIPKIINYVWMGGGKHSKLQKKCIKSWSKFCPDYEIKLWNETNYDFSKAPQYVKDAYDAKKYAFVSDYVRLWALYNYGGIYFDTDSQVLKNIDHLLENNAFMAFENDKMVTTGVSGCCKGDVLIKELLNYYEDKKFYNDDGTLNTEVTGKKVTDVFLNHGLVLNGQEQDVGNWHIYPFNYFYPIKVIHNKTFYTDDTCVVHWFEGTWFPQEYKKARKHNKNPFIRAFRKLGLAKLYYKMKGKK